MAAHPAGKGTSPGACASSREREFTFSDQDFAALRTLVRRVTGINLSDAKRELVYGRLSRRLRALGLGSFREYRALLERDGEQEMVQFCNAITTNLTAFFRESHHFEFLADHLRRLPISSSRRLRIWSAGCSTGEEAYSIAMTVREALPEAERWDVKILATDLDSNVLAHAKRGVYAQDRVRGLSEQRLRTSFSNDSGTFTVRPELARMIVFKQLNLMDPFPMRGPLDAIFCRNVVIYFDKDTQRDLFARFARLQQPEALLFLGHSESLFRVSADYALLGKTMYRRV